MILVKAIARSVFWVASAIAFTACVDSSSDGESRVEDSFDFQAMLVNYADNLIIPQYQNVAESIDALTHTTSGAIANYCNALGTDEELAQRSAAQEAWRQAMNHWQLARFYDFGPLAGDTDKNRISSFATPSAFNACLTDQSIILAQDASFNLSGRSTSSKSLEALEYLLFNDDLAHNCNATVALTSNWNALPEAERKIQRCEYAQQVASDIAEASQTILNGWVTEEGNYRSRFINPNNIASAIKLLSDGIFYIEKYTKDAKLGEPLGLCAICDGSIQPQKIESPYSDDGLARIRANVAGFKIAFNGGDGLGFDDLIREQDFPEVVDAINTRADTLLNLIDNSEASYAQQAALLQGEDSAGACANSSANPDVESPFSVCRIHGVLKQITDQLRTDFITIVNVDLPESVGGDAD